MKKLSLLMLLLSGALSFAPLRAGVVDTAGAQQAATGIMAASPDGPSYALASAITGTVSATIDLTNYAGILVSVSSTPGGPGVEVQWNIDSTASPAMAWTSAETLLPGIQRPLKKQGNQVRFRVVANASRPNLSPWTLKTTVTYIPIVNWESVSCPGCAGTAANPAYCIITSGSGSSGITVTNTASNPVPIYAPTPLNVSFTGGAGSASSYPEFVSAPAMTNYIQVGYGFQTQETKDLSRNNVVLYDTAIAPATTATEQLLTMTLAVDTGVTSTAGTFVLTNGKHLRITSIALGQMSNATATTASTIFRMRVNTSGAVTTSSTPVVWQYRLANPATVGQYVSEAVPIPDGMEFAGNGTVQIGFTIYSTFTTNAPTCDITVTGFYY